MSKFNSRSSKELDDEFEKFIMKESMTSSESSLDTRALASLEEKLNSGRGKNWASQIYDEDDDDGSSSGLLGTGKKFLKSAKVDSVKKVSPRNLNSAAQKAPLVKRNSDTLDLSVSRDSLDQGNGKSSLHLGRDTLEEIADKERFFSDMEKNLSNVPDYSKLNRDLDKSNTGTLQFNGYKPSSDPPANHEEDDSSDEDGDKNSVVNQMTKNSVVNQEKSNITRDNPGSMLSQVALIDSLDSTLEKKHLGSQDATIMHTIAEGTGEQTEEMDSGIAGKAGSGHAPPSHGAVIVEDDDEEEEDEESDSKITGDTTTKGVTGKTVTGFTDTCHDFEALQKELSKFKGLETFGSSNNFTFEETSAFGDTRFKESTATTAGETGRIQSVTAGGAGKTTLSELNRVGALAVSSSNTAKQFQPSKRRSKYPQPVGQQQLQQQQQPSVRFNEETQEISQSQSVNDELPQDEIESWFTDTKRLPMKKYDSAENNISETKPTSILPRTSSSAAAGVGTRQSRERFVNVKSSGYGHRSPAAKISAAKSLWSPDLRHSKSIGTKQHGSNIKTGVLTGNSQVLAGNQLSEFSADPYSSPFLQKKSLSDMVMSPSEKPMMSSSLKGQEDEVGFWNERYKTEVTRVAKLQAAMSAMEKEHATELARTKKDYEHRILKLQQENFALSAKVEAEQESRLKRLAEVRESNSVPGDKLAELEAEMRQQDTLLVGYQTENERLYEELKKRQAAGKTTEEKMFNENQKLKKELANLREELSSKDMQLKHFKESAPLSAVPGATRIAHLESELKQAKVTEGDYRTEIEEVHSAKNDLEKKMAEKVRQLDEQLSEALSMRSKETKEVEEYHRRELDGLKKKLRWYTQNQELLDKDVAILKQKDDEIKQLQVKLKEFELDTGKKTQAMKSNSKQRSSDAKKIQDLERQVREMETILKKRHPNSLPVLMWAASSVPDGKVPKPASVEYLEGRIHELEDQLEKQDDLANRSARALEQKYNQAVLQYEGRIRELEHQVTKYQHDVEASVQPHTTLLALQRELDSVRERNKKLMTEQEQTIVTLTKELSVIRKKEPGKPAASETNRDGFSEKADGSDNSSDQQRLLDVVKKLSVDNQHLAGDLRRMAEKLAEATSTVPAGKKKQTKITTISGKTFRRKRLDGAEAAVPLLPIYSDAPFAQKEYDPEVFNGQHISELVEENDVLTTKVESLTIEMEQQRVMLQKLVAEQEASERCHQEEMEEHVSALREAHQTEMQRLVATHAVELSSSQVAELRNRTSAQEVVILHLKEQLAQSLVDSKQITSLQSTKVSLENQVKQLCSDLEEARKIHTPQMRHFEMLQEKIRQMEMRHRQREQQMGQLVQQNQVVAAEEVAEEAAKWKKIVESKTKEINRFRNELDSILDILTTLQRQGVVIPYAGRTALLNSNEGTHAFSNHSVQ